VAEHGLDRHSKFTGSAKRDLHADHPNRKLLNGGLSDSTNAVLTNSATFKQRKRSRVGSVDRTVAVSSKKGRNQVEVVEMPSSVPEIIVDENSADDLDNDTFDDIISEALNEDGRRSLKRDVIQQLECTPGLPVETGTKDTLAEFVVYMLLARKRPSDVLTELKEFLGNHTPGFVAWLTTHLKGPCLRERRAHAGVTSTAATPCCNRRQN